MTAARLAVLPLLLALTLLAGCGEDTSEAADGSTSIPDPREPALPEGWRWESYAGVQVGVPGDFGWTNSGQRVGQWCVGGGDEPLPPAVGRPGVSTLVGCPTGDPDPATLVENTGVVVVLQQAWEDDPTASDQGDQSVRRLGDVLVRVIGPAELREQVLATAHETDVDARGCAMQLPPDVRPGSAPSPAVDVAMLEGVTALSACRYSIASGDVDGPSRLLSSLQLEGEPASKVVTAIAAAPVGGGPDRPDACAVDYAYGDEFLVVQIDSQQGRSVLHVYYSGCDHNGFDDGRTMRSLTRDGVQPLLRQGNAPSSWSGTAEKTEMLRP